MAETNIPFRSRARALVALIALEGHPNRVYLYSKWAGEEYSWAMRDYLTERMVRSGDSAMTASEVEALVEHAEQPPSCPVKRIDFWKDHCLAASERHFGTGHVDSVTPNPAVLGDWKSLDGGRV